MLASLPETTAELLKAGQLLLVLVTIGYTALNMRRAWRRQARDRFLDEMEGLIAGRCEAAQRGECPLCNRIQEEIRHRPE